MSIHLYYHPYSRAAGTVWALEEAGVPYELEVIDLTRGEQKGPALIAKNPMGKLPTLVDGETVVTEAAAIALYLADRYAPGRLAPAPDDPRRGTYLRWALFAPSVIEPAVMAREAGWDVKEVSAGWGNRDAMMAAVESAVAGRDFVLGDAFSMADVVFGGTLRFMAGFERIERAPGQPARRREEPGHAPKTGAAVSVPHPHFHSAQRLSALVVKTSSPLSFCTTL